MTLYNLKKNISSNKSLYIAQLIVVIISMINNIAHPVTPKLILSNNFPAYTNGTLFGFMALTGTISSFFVGKYSDRYQAKYFLLVGCFGYSITQLLFSWEHNLFLIHVWRCFSGIFGPMPFTILIIYITRLTKGKERTKHLMYYTASTLVAGSIGRLIGGYVGLMHFHYAFYLQAIASFMLAIGAYLFLPSLGAKHHVVHTFDEIIEKEKSSEVVANQTTDKKSTATNKGFKSRLVNVYNNYFSRFTKSEKIAILSTIVLLAMFTLESFSRSILENTNPFYLVSHFKLNSADIGTYQFFISIVSFIAIIYGVKFLISTFSEIKTILLTTIMSAVLIILFSTFDTIFSRYWIAILFLGVTSIFEGVIRSYIIDNSYYDYGKTNGIIQSVAMASRTIAAFLSGWLYELNINAPFWTSALSIFILVALFAYYIKNNKIKMNNKKTTN